MTEGTDFIEIPGLGLSVATTPSPDKGKSVYEATRLLDSQLLVLPGSREWTEALAYFEGHDQREAVTSMIIAGYGRKGGNSPEITRSIIAWPDANGNYSDILNPRPQKGNYTLLIEGYKVKSETVETPPKKEGEEPGKMTVYTLTDVVVVGEIPNLPQRDGILEEDIHVLGLTKGAYFFSTSNTKYEQGLRAVVRGWSGSDIDSHTAAYARMGPSSDKMSGLTFRAAKRI